MHVDGKHEVNATWLQVAWVPQEKRGEFGVLSACSGGMVLLWSLDLDPGTLVLQAGYALITQQVPQSSSSHTKVRLRLPGMNITCTVYRMHLHMYIACIFTCISPTSHVYRQLHMYIACIFI